MPTAAEAVPEANGAATLTTDLRPPESIRPHPDNPRGHIDLNDPALLELAADIRVKGIVQPIVITPDGWILAGHRRQAAAMLANQELVPVVVRELGKMEHAEDYFISENELRKDLTLLQLAKALKHLHAKLERQTRRAVTFGDLSRRVNLGTDKISKLFLILDMPESVQKLYDRNDLPIGSVRVLYRLVKHPQACEEIAAKVASRAISSNSLEAVVRRKLELLAAEGEALQVAARQPRIDRIQGRGRVNHVTDGPPPVTRAIAVKSLAENRVNSITMGDVLRVMETCCSNCELLGVDVCKVCPLPKFAHGLVGRSEKPAGWRGSDA